MQPVSLNEVAQFIQLLIDAFSPTLFYAFTAMLGGVIAYHVKRLFLD